jgi:hypothetical protein
MADAKTPEQIGKEKLSAAAQEAAGPKVLTDAEKAKIARRFVWQPGDITITSPAERW